MVCSYKPLGSWELAMQSNVIPVCLLLVDEEDLKGHRHRRLRCQECNEEKRGHSCGLDSFLDKMDWA